MSGVHPAQLLASTIKALLDRTAVRGEAIDDVIAGCVAQVGDQALNIGRTASLVAGLPESVPATTVDRQCGSSQQAAHFAAQGVISGAYDIAIACGVESMSRIPLGMSDRGGDPTGPLDRRYPAGLVNQGVSAELVTTQWKFGRGELDEFSARSHQRAAAAADAGAFDNEIIGVDVLGEGGALRQHLVDQTVRADTTVEGLAGLKPSFYTEELAGRFPRSPGGSRRATHRR